MLSSATQIDTNLSILPIATKSKHQVSGKKQSSGTESRAFPGNRALQAGFTMVLGTVNWLYNGPWHR